jgi:hypothetical protein
MGEALQAKLAAILTKVRDVVVPDARTSTAAWCVQKLPALYAGLSATQESRYAEQIDRLVRGLLKELAGGDKEARVVGKDLAGRFQRLHERFGLPTLHLQVSAGTSPRPRKTG